MPYIVARTLPVGRCAVRAIRRRTVSGGRHVKGLARPDQHEITGAERTEWVRRHSLRRRAERWTVAEARARKLVLWLTSLMHVVTLPEVWSVVHFSLAKSGTTTPRIAATCGTEAACTVEPIAGCALDARAAEGAANSAPAASAVIINFRRNCMVLLR